MINRTFSSKIANLIQISETPNYKVGDKVKVYTWWLNNNEPEDILIDRIDKISTAEEAISDLDSRQDSRQNISNQIHFNNIDPTTPVFLIKGIWYYNYWDLYSRISIVKI